MLGKGILNGNILKYKTLYTNQVELNELIEV